MSQLRVPVSFWTIGKKLGLGFCSVLLLLVLIASVALNRFDTVDDAIHEIVDIEWQKSQAATTISEIVDANTIATMQQILVPAQERPALRQSILQERERFQTAHRYLIQAVTTVDGKKALEQLEVARQSYVASQNRFQQLLDDGFTHEAQAELLGNTLPQLREVQKTLENITRMAQTNAQQHSSDALALIAQASQWIAALSVAALALGGIVAWRMTRAITQPLTQAVRVADAVAAGNLTSTITITTGDETGQLLGALNAMNQGLLHIVTEVRGASTSIASATSQIATGNMDLSGRTEEQASALEETSAAMQEILTTVENNHANSQQAHALAHKATEVAQRGGQVMTDAVATMHNVNASGQKIAEFVGLIEGIAFQTNILALNAAVEAARAGEQGRGFAVVAAEVRALAGRSATASKEIKTLMQSSIDDISLGCQLVDKAGTTMQEIVQSIHNVAVLVGDITDASRDQSAGLEQIKNAVVQMDTVTQQNAALVEEGASAAQSLEAQAQGLMRTVSIFQTADALQWEGASHAPRLPATAQPRHAAFSAA